MRHKSFLIRLTDGYKGVHNIGLHPWHQYSPLLVVTTIVSRYHLMALGGRVCREHMTLAPGRRAH